MLKVDQKHEEFLTFHVRKQSHFKVHVYFFDSLSTTVREFRTIKCSEFFPTINLILRPYDINEINQDFQNNETSQNMLKYIDKHKKAFNGSQLEALTHVAKMKSVDFLLI